MSQTDELSVEQKAKLARQLVDAAPKFKEQLLKAGLKGAAKHFDGALFKIMLMETIHLEKIVKARTKRPEPTKKKK